MDSAIALALRDKCGRVGHVAGATPQSNCLAELDSSKGELDQLHISNCKALTCLCLYQNVRLQITPPQNAAAQGIDKTPKSLLSVLTSQSYDSVSSS
eukprot:1528968-Amphidinium_carterae.1